MVTFFLPFINDYESHGRLEELLLIKWRQGWKRGHRILESRVQQQGSLGQRVTRLRVQGRWVGLNRQIWQDWGLSALPPT